MATGSNGGGGGGGASSPQLTGTGSIPTSPMDEAIYFEKPRISYFNLAVQALGGKSTRLTEWAVNRIMMAIGISGNSTTPTNLSISPDPTLVAGATTNATNGFSIQGTNLPFSLHQSSDGLLAQVEWYGVIPPGGSSAMVTVVEQRLIKWPQAKAVAPNAITEDDYREIIKNILRSSGGREQPHIPAGIDQACRSYHLSAKDWICDDQ